MSQLSTEDAEALEQAIAANLSQWDTRSGAEESDMLPRELARMTAIAARHCLLPNPTPDRTVCDVRTRLSHYRVSTTYIRNAPTGPDTIVVLVNSVDPQKASLRDFAARFLLTRRETETAELLGKRLSNREIGTALGISVNTARRHVESVLAKLGVHSRSAVAARLEDFATVLLGFSYCASLLVA